MGIALNHPAEGAVGWFPQVDGNWTTLESQYVARLKSDTSVVTVSGTTAETVLMANTTVPANALAIGTVLANWSAGGVTIPASSTPSVTWRLRWGGLAGTLLYSWTWNFATNPAAYSLGWVIDSRIVGVTTGVSGTAEVDNWMGVGGTFSDGLSTGVSTLDTTTSKVLVWTAQASLSTVSVSQRVMVTNLG